MNTINNPIFLVGCPRSGTTLLQQMLDAHPAVAIAPETHFMHYFWDRRDSYGNLNIESNYQKILDNLTDLPEFSEMGLSEAYFRSAAITNSRNYGALLSLLLEQFANHRNVKVVGEKTPNHVLYLPILKKFFPSARFVHIVRDPRAVVNSWRSVPWSNGNLTQDAQAWRAHVAAPRRCNDEVKSALFTLSYEKLVREPEAVLHSLCEFLELEFTPQMLTYHQTNSPLVNVSREPWKAGAVKPVSHAPLYRWQTQLSPEAIAEIEAVTWWEMRHYGYQAQTNLARLLPLAVGKTFQRRYLRLNCK